MGRTGLFYRSHLPVRCMAPSLHCLPRSVTLLTVMPHDTTAPAQGKVQPLSPT